LVKKKRLVQHGSTGSVQQFNKKIEHKVSVRRVKPLPSPLPQSAKDILQILGAGGVAGNAIALTGLCKSAVSWWVKRFVTFGALILKESQDQKTLGLPKKFQHVGPGLPRYYELTAYGSNLLTGSESQGRLYVVFEDMPMKFGVVQWEPVGVIDWEKLGRPNNWQKLGIFVSGVRVVRTSKSVIIHPGPLHGFDVDQLQVESGRIIERVKNILEVKMKLQLDSNGVFCHGPMWQVFRPEAREWIKQGGSVKMPGVGCLDASPKPWMKKLSEVPHVEFENKRHAAIASVWPPVPVASDPEKQNASAAVMYPRYLEEIHGIVSLVMDRVEALSVDVNGMKPAVAQIGQIGGVAVELHRLAESLSKLENLDKLQGIAVDLQRIACVLGKLTDLESDQSAGESKVGGGKDYVS